MVVDTTVLYAAADRSHRNHAAALTWLRTSSDALLVTPTVVAETCYLTDRRIGPTAEAAFLDDVGTNEAAIYRLVNLTGDDLFCMAERPQVYHAKAA